MKSFGMFLLLVFSVLPFYGGWYLGRQDLQKDMYRAGVGMYTVDTVTGDVHFKILAAPKWDTTFPADFKDDNLETDFNEQ